MSATREAAPQRWWLYVVETARGALYTGITTDVERRLAEHAAGRGAKALRGKGPLVLRYREAVGSHGEALRREAAVKRLSAAAKRAWLAAEPGGGGEALSAASGAGE